MKRTETIQTAIETKARINLVNDLDALNKIFSANSPLLRDIKVQSIGPDVKGGTNLNQLFFKDGKIRTELIDANIDRYVQDETNRLLKEVEETQQDFQELRKTTINELEDIATECGPNPMATRIKQLIYKIERNE